VVGAADLQFLVEVVWTREEAVTGPGRTAASDGVSHQPPDPMGVQLFERLQIVPGIASLRIGGGPERGDHAVLFYLSSSIFHDGSPDGGATTRSSARSPLEKLYAHRIPGLMETPRSRPCDRTGYGLFPRPHDSTRKLKVAAPTTSTLAPRLYATVVASSPTALLAEV